MGGAVSAAPEGIKPELWDRHAAACAGLREAEEALHAAMADLKSRVATWVRVEAEISGDRAVDALVGIAASSGATWGGGCLSENNIIETTKRREALDLLRRESSRQSALLAAIGPCGK